MRKILASVLLVFFTVHSFSQPHPGWTNYDYNQNITDIEVRGNHLWISTQGGLIKYNKTTGEKTFFNRANANLPDNNLIGFCMNEESDIWLGGKYWGIGNFKNGQCTNYNMSNSGLPFDQYNVEMKQDKDGNVWIASFRWMARFDGNTWHTWETGSDFSAYPVISGFDIDTSGVVWIFSTDGIGKIENDEYTVLSTVGSSLISKIGSVKVDNEQNVWFAIEKQGLYKYDGVTFTHYSDTISCLQGNIIYDITFDTQNKMWLGTSEGLIQFNYPNCRVFPAPESLLRIKTDGNDTIWCGTLGGKLLCFDGNNYNYIDISGTPLNDHIITKLFVDGHNNKWIATRNHTFLKTDEQFIEIYKKLAAAFAGDNSGATWVAFNTGDTCLLKITDETTEVFTSTNSPFSGVKINSMAVDANNLLWISTSNGIYTYNGDAFTNYNTTNSSIPSNYIGLIIFDHTGNLWGALNGNNVSDGICRFDGTTWTVWNTSNSAIPTSIILGMDVDSENNIWFSCMDEGRTVGKEWGGGLTCFNGQTMTTYNISNSGLLCNTVFDVYIDRNDKVWLATVTDGLMSFDKKNDVWESYNVGNSGIAHNWIQQIEQDKEGNLWLGSPRAGVSVFKVDTLSSSLTRIEKSMLSFQVFPNPVNDVLQVKLNTTGEKQVQTSIFDLQGRLVYVFPEQFVARGNSTISLQLPQSLLRDQMYLLKVNCGKEHFISKFLYRK